MASSSLIEVRRVKALLTVPDRWGSLTSAGLVGVDMAAEYPVSRIGVNGRQTGRLTKLRYSNKVVILSQNRGWRGDGGVAQEIIISIGWLWKTKAESSASGLVGC